MSTEAIAETSPTLVLTAEERSVVLDLMEEALGAIRMEVRHTRTPDFHDRLKAREVVIRDVIAKLHDLH
jgi:hypothetical protein